MAVGRWVMLVLTLAAPARAELLEGGWTHDLDLSFRAGASHLVTELAPAQPLQDGNDRFRRSSTGVFLAVSVRL